MWEQRIDERKQKTWKKRAHDFQNVSQGRGALSVAQGEPVEVTGVMKNLKEKQVFVTRTVKARGQIYQIRNKYGILFSPQSRDRAGEKAVQKQESL